MVLEMAVGLLAFCWPILFVACTFADMCFNWALRTRHRALWLDLGRPSAFPFFLRWFHDKTGVKRFRRDRRTLRSYPELHMIHRIYVALAVAHVGAFIAFMAVLFGIVPSAA